MLDIAGQSRNSLVCLLILPPSYRNRPYFLFRPSHRNSPYPFMVTFFFLFFYFIIYGSTIHYTISITFSLLLFYQLHIKTRVNSKGPISMGRREYFGILSFVWKQWHDLVISLFILLSLGLCWDKIEQAIVYTNDQKRSFFLAIPYLAQLLLSLLSHKLHSIRLLRCPCPCLQLHLWFDLMLNYGLCFLGKFLVLSLQDRTVGTR